MGALAHVGRKVARDRAKFVVRQREFSKRGPTLPRRQVATCISVRSVQHAARSELTNSVRDEFRLRVRGVIPSYHGGHIEVELLRAWVALGDGFDEHRQRLIDERIRITAGASEMR